MVPYGVFREALGLCFTKHFMVSLIFFRYLWCSLQGDEGWLFFELLGMYRDPSNVILVLGFHSWFVLSSRDELCSFGVWGFEYYWKLSVVDPPSLPVDFWLYGREPWVS